MTGWVAEISVEGTTAVNNTETAILALQAVGGGTTVRQSMSCQ